MFRYPKSQFSLCQSVNKSACKSVCRTRLSFVFSKQSRKLLFKSYFVKIQMQNGHFSTLSRFIKVKRGIVRSRDKPPSAISSPSSLGGSKSLLTRGSTCQEETDHCLLPSSHFQDLRDLMYVKNQSVFESSY